MGKYIFGYPLIGLILIMIIAVYACKDSKEEDPLTANNLNQVEGNFQFTSATFHEMVDLDGQGPIIPTDNALNCLYDILNIYMDCPSDEPIFEFKAGIFQQYCETTGLSREICGYSFVTDNQSINLFLITWNNPGDLYHEFKPLLLDIEQANKVNGLWRFQGVSYLRASIDPTITLWFDFEMQEVIIE